MEGYGRSSSDKYSSNKGKEPWMSYYYGGEGAPPPSGLIGAGFSWPPRCYVCSFCKREFRSAQALGGHMNVHRRDKARLRQCSPPPMDPPVTNPNPNYLNSNLIPNLNMPPPAVQLAAGDRIFPVSYSFPFMLSPHQLPFSSSSSRSADDDTKNSTAGAILKPLSEFKELEELFGEGTKNGLIRKSIVKLDLEIGAFEDEEENLDLELRLGCS